MMAESVVIFRIARAMIVTRLCAVTVYILKPALIFCEI
jgi:hypothetical protein